MYSQPALDIFIFVEKKNKDKVVIFTMWIKREYRSAAIFASLPHKVTAAFFPW